MNFKTIINRLHHNMPQPQQQPQPQYIPQEAPEEPEPMD